MDLKIISYSSIPQNEYKEAFPHVTEPESKDGINIWYGFYNNSEFVGYCTVNIQLGDVFIYNFSIIKGKRGHNYGYSYLQLINDLYTDHDIYLFCKKALIKYYNKSGFKQSKKYTAPLCQICMTKSKKVYNVSV